MPQARSISYVLKSGVALDHQTAIAIAKELIASIAAGVDVAPPFGPPSLDNVVLESDGSVTCRACATSPAVFEIALLLDAMLPHDSRIRVPGALRYTIARGLHEVDVPPFHSLRDFAAALERHAAGDRRALLRKLYARVDQRDSQPVAVRFERRRRGASPAELRRQLREADERLFRARIAETHARTAPLPKRAASLRFDVRGWAFAAAAATLIAVGAGYEAVQWAEHVPDMPAPIDGSPRAAAPAVIDSAPPIGGRLTARDRISVNRGPTHKPPVIRVARAGDPGWLPTFASTSTAMFVQREPSPDSPNALPSADTGSDDLRVITVESGSSRNYHAQRSPDGSQVAFDSDRDGVRGVYVARADGTEVRRVTGAEFAALPTWSPDGMHIAFVRAESDRSDVWNLWLTSLDGRQLTRLTRFQQGQTSAASWFADGRRICYTHGDRLVIVDISTGATQDFKSPVAARFLYAPAVSPDGAFVIFQVAGSGGWVLDARDGTTKFVLTDATVGDFAWSPDGRRVAYHSRRDDQWGIWRVTPAAPDSRTNRFDS